MKTSAKFKNIPESAKALMAEAKIYEEQGLALEASGLYRQILVETTEIDSSTRKWLRKKLRGLEEILNDPLTGNSPSDLSSKIAFLDEDGVIYHKKNGAEKNKEENSLIKKFTAYTLKQKVFINVVYILLTLIGLFALFSSPVENMPAVDLGEVYITTWYYGASADEIENLVTIPVEKAVDGLENVESVTSRSYRNCSSVGVKFKDDSDYRELFSRLRIRILNMRSALPDGCDDPKFLFVDTHWWISVIRVNLFGNIPKESQRQLAEKLKREILNVPGVRDIEVTGKYLNEFHVSLNPLKLREYGITFAEVADSVRSAGVRIPTGHFTTEKSEYILDAGNRFKSQEDVLNIIIKKDGYGNFIRVADLVTNARISHKSPMNIVSINGNDTVSLVIRKEDDGNAIKIARQVKAISNKFVENHKKDGINLAYTNDSTIEIDNATNTLSGNMILGIILVTIILWFTLGFRNAMLAAVGIPFSFLCALIIMKVTGISINSIDLFAFILVSGIIVDDAVIIIENVVRHQQMGKGIRQAIIDGVSEVFIPVISSALTTIMAFIPMLLMTGSIGDFFAVIPKTVAYSLIASTVEALLFLPLHIYDWGNRKTEDKDIIIEDEKPKEEIHLTKGVFSWIWRYYKPAEELLLAHRIKTIIVVSVLFIISIAIIGLSVTGAVPLIKIKFFPSNYIRYHVAVSLPPGTPIESTDKVVRSISRYIISLGDSQAESAAGSAGYYEDEDYRWIGGSQYGQVVVTLPDKKKASFPDNPTNDPMLHLKYIRGKLKEFISSNYKDDPVKPFIKIFPENTGPAAGKPVNIRLSGDNLEESLKVSTKIMTYLKNNPETSDLTEMRDDRAAFQKVIKYIPIQEKAYEYGISPGEITASVAGALNGTKAGFFRTSSEEIDLIVRLSRKSDIGNETEAGLEKPIDVINLPIIERSYAPVFLRDLVNISYEMEPDSRGRYNGKSAVTISAGISEGSGLTSKRVEFLVKKFFNEIKEAYPDITLSFGGESESTQRAYNSLIFGFFAAVLIIYLILASQFSDYFQPIIIISAVVFAITGVIFGMFFTRSIFTVGSFLAIIGLAGVTVNDSLILVDFINKGINEGKNLRKSVMDACGARMRPILITSITTMLGLLPMAIGIPYKSIEWAPMATAFVTGLGFSTVMTLLIVPVEYELIVKIKAYLRHGNNLL